jgi:hypothetical protein
LATLILIARLDFANPEVRGCSRCRSRNGAPPFDPHLLIVVYDPSPVQMPLYEFGRPAPAAHEVLHEEINRQLGEAADGVCPECAALQGF